jgi:hypothetical protein
MDHPFRIVGKYLFHSPELSLPIKNYLQPLVYCRAQLYKIQVKIEKTTSFEEIVSNLSGKINIFVTQNPMNLRLQFNSNSVVGFVWIPPWTLDVLKKYHYIELDASFRALRPYVYSIPLAIHANEAFPLALVVGLSENVELYSMFFKAMEAIGVTRDMFSQKPFLSDQHMALKTVCTGFTHFFCFRHLIENFGSGSFVGQIVRRLAFSSTEIEFLYQTEISVLDLEALQEKNALDEKQLKRLFKTFGTINSDGKMDFDINSWNNQAVWTRANFGVSTCSNHIEGFYRALNKATKNATLLTRRLHKVIKYIEKRFESASMYCHTQGTKLLKKLVHMQKSLHIERCDICQDERCGWKKYYSSILFTSFPCVHEVGTKQIEWFKPEQLTPENIVQDSIEVVDYHGSLEISHLDDSYNIPKNSIENECYRDTETTSAFIVTLATEISNISRKGIEYQQLVATLSAWYYHFLDGEEDTFITRSNFRVECWLKAESGDIEIW